MLGKEMLLVAAGEKINLIVTFSGYPSLYFTDADNVDYGMDYQGVGKFLVKFPIKIPSALKIGRSVQAEENAIVTDIGNAPWLNLGPWTVTQEHLGVSKIVVAQDY